MQRNFFGSRSSYPLLKRLSLLLEAGIPLSRALESIGGGDVVFREKIMSGGAFADSIDPSTLSPRVLALIRAGEKTGDLAGAVSRACASIERSASFSKKMVASLAYPAFVMAAALASIAIAGSIMLPSFSGILGGMGVQLPPLSRFLLFVFRNMPLLLVVAAFLAGGLIRFIFSDPGLRLPLIGKLRLKIFLSSFYRSMSEMLHAGSGMIESLEVSSASVSSRRLREIILRARDKVAEGSSLAASLASSGSMEDTDIYLISAGESSSSLDRVFDQLADRSEEEIENGLKFMTGLIEPMSTLAVGFVVAIIVLGMFMPIIKLIGAFGG